MLNKTENDIVRDLNKQELFYSSMDFNKNVILYLIKTLAKNNNYYIQLVFSMEKKYKEKKISKAVL
jgi:hypothetical protein